MTIHSLVKDVHKNHHSLIEGQRFLSVHRDNIGPFLEIMFKVSSEVGKVLGAVS